MVVAVAAELAPFTCTFALQRLALQARGWSAVVTAGLAGNAVSGIVPGGAATPQCVSAFSARRAAVLYGG